MVKNVLYISYDGMTDNLGQSQVIPYLIGLGKEGYAIHILSCEKAEAYNHRKKYISQLLQTNNIIWHPIPYTPKPAVLSTVYDIQALRKKAIQIVKEHNISLLHCRSYISAHIGLHLHKKYNLPWIFDMRGFWADERIDGGIWNKKNILFRTVYSYFKQMEKKFIANASHIISLTHAGEKEITSWPAHKHSKTPITVIPCCADLKLFSYKSIPTHAIERLRLEMRISDNAFVISYLGSFGTWYETEEMFRFFKQLHNAQKNAIFLCITPDTPESLYVYAEKMNIPRNALRILKAHREDVPLYAALSNWSLFFIKPLYSKLASSPTKMGELLGLGIPLICNNRVGDVEEIMGHCEQGIVVKSFDENNYSSIIETILEQKTINREQLYSVATEFYSLTNGIEKYKSVYQRLT